MYYLKYYAEIQNFRGQFSRVEIHQAGTRPQTVLQIGDVCGLDLEIQGSQDDVFTPIVKTQAHLSMISSDDKPTERGIKYGGWGEFFTPDATLYKMLIKTRATEQDPWTTRWTGYITPDSWQEDLGYRTPVTITARDNIGHLQDFEFDFDNYDKYGLASIRSIITAGMNLIELPMTLDMNSAPANFQAAGTDVLDAMVMCRHFEGKDWYSVIESLLDAIGYTLRYTDNNRVTLAPIRYLPNGGRGTGGDNRSNAVPVQFYDGNGVVVPAVKSIIEEHNYDYLGEVEIPIRSSDINYGTEGSYKAYVKWTNTRPGMEGKDAPVYSIVDGGSTNWLPGSDLYKTEDPSLLTLDREGESWDDYIFLAANGKRYTDAEGKRKQALQFTTRTPNVTLRAKFNSNPLSVLQDIVVPEDPEYEEEIKGGFVLENIGLYTFEFKIKYESNGETVYWDDTAGWVTEEVTNTRTFEPSSMTTDVEIQLESASGMEGHGVMTFYFENIQYETSGISSLIVACHGVYARLSSFTIEPNTINLSKNTVKTNSDERYNVILRRNPEVSPLSRDVLFALPENYETGLFYYPSGSNFPEQYPYQGNWSNLNTSATKPLPVIIHQQILAFRGGVLWELSGECAPIDGGILFANQLVRYKDRVYLITSGTIDFYGSGNLLSAVLREYVDYDDIWDDTEQGDWSGDGEYNTIGGETASGSGHSGSSGGGGGSATNFFELDGNGGVKLKDRYDGLSAKGFITAGGMGSTSEEGGADLQSVWLSLKTNEDQFANEKIHAGHLPIGSGLTINSQGLIDVTVQGGVTSVAGMTGDVSAASLKTALGLGSLAYKSSLQASDIPMITTAKISDIGAAATYGVGSVASGNNGLVTGGAVYAAINSALSSAIKYQGVTTTPLTDGATTNPITIDGASYTAKSGDEVIYGGREYLYTGSKWQQLGDEESWALKTVSITGTGYLTGGGTLEASRTIDIAASVKTKIENGATAYGWGNHANAGYFAASSFTAANIVSTLGTTAVNRATADADGNDIVSTYATVTALNGVSGRVSTLEGRTNWDNYFGIDANGDVYVKMKDANNARNFYGYGAVTAGGVGSSSGGGGGEGASLLAVWRSLTNNNSLVDADITSTLKIAVAHIPDLSISKVTGLQTALDGKQATISDLSTIRSNANLGASAYNALPNYLPLNGGLISGTLIAFDSAGLPTYGGSRVPASRTAIGYNGIAIAGIDTADDGAAIFIENAGTEKNRLVIALGDDRAQAGTDDWIEFRHYNTSGNYASIKVPFTAGTLALTSDLSAYLPLSGGTMTGSIVPNRNSTIDFGSATAKWHYVYAHRILNVQSICNSTTYNENMLTLPSKSGTIAVTSDLSAYLPLTGGSMSSGAYVSLASTDEYFSGYGYKYTGGIQLREYAYSGTTYSDTAQYAPGITFHWSGRYVGKLSLYDDKLHWDTNVIWHSGNSNLSTVSWATNNIDVYGDGHLRGGYLFMNFNSDGIYIHNSGISWHGSNNGWLADLLKFTSDGNVGIGTTSPACKLDVAGWAQATNIKVTYHGGTDHAIDGYHGDFLDDHFNIHLGSSSGDFNVMNDNWTPLFRVVRSNGYVGIGYGNTDPSYKLDVNGAVASATFFTRKAINAQNGKLVIGQPSSGYDDGIYYNTNENWFRIQTQMPFMVSTTCGDTAIATRYDLYIGTSGYVGLGTNTPSYKLDVSGTFQATGNSLIGGTLGVTGATTLSGALTVNNTASISGNTTIGGNATIGGNIYMTAGNSIDLDGGLDVIYYDSSNTTVYFNFDYASHFSSGIYSDSFITAGGVNASSDARLKDNLSAISAEKALSVLMQLRPMEWVWNEKNAYLEGNIGAGLVAQEVESVLPFAVSRDTEYLSLNYNVFHAYEIAAIQKHETELQAMKRKLADAERKIEHLERVLAEVRAN